ncbi:MAG: motility associated factor glycosyltransferase family protein [Phycisphaeraceae bacterium]|nr:motility associated factor glycosyltransferase family protein [Phycisphaeraceae bacterium]
MEQSVLEKNLAKLARTEPQLVQRLKETAAAAVQWQTTPNGQWTATIDHQDRALWLTSRFDPQAEAQQILKVVDFQKHACVVVLGVGLGYHVALAAEKMGVEGVLVVFEPDLALLRAVLEKIDHTSWLGKSNIILADPQMDRAGFLTRIEQGLSILTLGTVLVNHPPTRQRHGESLAAFGKMVIESIGYCRTHVATALVNATRTIENYCLNLAHYAAGADTNDLHNAAQGRMGVCVSAGPSLVRNVDLLRDPAVRRRVVVITAQTTLRPLLDRGIEPDFVTALDYHEISRRFYEGLPRLPGVTLVAEPLAHPAIVDSFPGPVRLTQSGFLDRLLGARLSRPRVAVPYGSTVAHLSFNFAQHLGCDPIVLIGQDLGFSDGLYYCPGTAIHQVWGGELSRFNTVEMMEWQRIVRHRRNLQKLQDVHGQAIYTDEQMLTYLKQFEKDFSNSRAQVIDATEGGLPKAHTTRLTFKEALAQFATQDITPLPLAKPQLDPAKLKLAAGVLEERIDQVHRLRQLSKKTLPILAGIHAHMTNPAKMRKLMADLNRQRGQVDGELSVAFGLVNELNTLGAFRRARADYAIAHAADDPQARQKLQLERDRANVDLLVAACDETHKIFSSALTKIRSRLEESPPAVKTLPQQSLAIAGH